MRVTKHALRRYRERIARGSDIDLEAAIRADVLAGTTATPGQVQALERSRTAREAGDGCSFIHSRARQCIFVVRGSGDELLVVTVYLLASKQVPRDGNRNRHSKVIRRRRKNERRNRLSDW